MQVRPLSNAVNLSFLHSKIYYEQPVHGFQEKKALLFQIEIIVCKKISKMQEESLFILSTLKDRPCRRLGKGVCTLLYVHCQYTSKKDAKYSREGYIA